MLNQIISSKDNIKNITDRISINPFTLSFEKEELNKNFNDALTNRSLKLSRVSILFAISLYLIYGYLDDYILPDAEVELIKIRVIGILIFSIVIALTFHSSIKKYYQVLMSSFIFIGGTNVIWLVLTSEKYGEYSLYAGIILTIIYAHSLLRLRFIYASLSSWYLIILYGSTTILINQTSFENLINNGFYVISANILGMFASYGIEYYMRSDFLKALQIKEQSLELESEYKRKSLELESARQIQLSLLPQELPEHPLLDFSVSMKTASEIGGDYYDFHLSEDNTLTFAIGDATGHGAQAGAMVTALKILFSNYANKLDIIEFMKKADFTLKQIRLPRLYMSFVIGKLTRNILEITGVGMPPLVIYRAKTNSLEKINLKGLPLGSSVEFKYIKHCIELFPGDSLLLMTDGFPELFNKDREMFVDDRVENLFCNEAKHTPNKIIKKFNEISADWIKDYKQQDDITILVIKMKEIHNQNVYDESLNNVRQLSY